VVKFFGKVGYGQTAEVEGQNGVWDDVITEVPYYGDVVRNDRRLVTGQEVNADITVGNSISILADAYANNNFFAIRYVEWAGALWTVENVDVQRPRLILRLGGVYNGPRPKAAAPGSPGTNAG
jgi:hypothetical protein